MAIYSISDLHLSLGTDKPMDVFGAGWEGYVEKIQKNWKDVVNADDTVIIPGDVSWAMYLEETWRDFQYLESLPGKKILLKGNHDYWWTTAAKMERYVAEKGIRSVFFLHNKSILTGTTAICGTRGWKNPADKDFTSEDMKIHERELIRLELSLRNGIEHKPETIIAALHYPPLGSDYEDRAFIDMLRKYRVDTCVYGHIHGEALKSVFRGNLYGIEFKMISADYVNFTPQLIELKSTS